MLWAAALALFVALIGYYGWADIATALLHAGSGLVIVVLFHFAPMIFDTLAWFVLLPKSTRLPFGQLMLIRWKGESVNSLLPVAQVGGDLLRGHLHSRAGVAGPTAQGIVVVDLATTVYAQMGFATLGLVCLASFYGGHDDLIWRLGISLGVLTVLIIGFFVAQRAGLFTRVVQAFEAMILAGAHRSRTYARSVDRTIGRLYRRRRPLLASIGLHLAAWLIGAGEIYLSAAFIGWPVTLLEALILESLVGVVRAAAFLVPGALGVQEGGFVVLGALFGLPPDQALAISIIRRVRELAFGVPGLLCWQFGEFVRTRGA